VFPPSSFTLAAAVSTVIDPIGQAARGARCGDLQLPDCIA
jgi:hypothetical protein